MKRRMSLVLGILASLSVGCQTLPMAKVHPAVSILASGQIDRIEVMRLLPGDDVRTTLIAWTKEHSVKAASIISAVGSVKQASLRFAGEPNETKLIGPFEIVSLSGTLSLAGVHLHMAVSDKQGKTLGGHLAEGSLVNTTLELVIAVYLDVEFLRKHDVRTGYSELFFGESK